MASIKELAQRLLEGDDTTLEEIKHLKGHDAQQLLDQVRKTKTPTAKPPQ